MNYKKLSAVLPLVLLVPALMLGTAGGVRVAAAADPVPVTNITVTTTPATAVAGTPITLNGTVVPSNATEKNIVWSMKSPGATGATIIGATNSSVTLNTTAAGTAVVTAKITNGTTGDSITAISVGSYHTLAVKSDGSLWAWGQNGSNQFGDGTNKDSNTPVKVGTDKTWSVLSAGSDHSLALKSDGSLWSWGNNSYGQLGDGTKITRSKPVSVGTDTNWVAISAGSYHSLALKSDGSLWAWGWNNYGQLGDGTNTDSNIPVRVGTDANWVAISSGSNHSLALKSDGSLWAWGNNERGQLGDTTNTNSNVPVYIEPGYVAISAGGLHSLALKLDGSLWAWGRNAYGQLGNTTNADSNVPFRVGTESDWTAISAGSNHSLALKSDGSLWAWGSNSYRQLGDGTDVNRSTPFMVGTDTDWTAIFAGSGHSLALKSSRNLYAWGYNRFGQLGDDTNTNRTEPVIAGAGMNSGASSGLVDYTKDFDIHVSPKIYDISLPELEENTYRFDAAKVGYANGSVTPYSVTVSNSGNQPTGALSVALSGVNAGSFTLSAIMPSNSIAVGGSGTFTVVPQNDLPLGTYTATVTVSGGNGILRHFDVIFSVIDLAGIAVTVPPTKIGYIENEPLVISGMVVTATYSDGILDGYSESATVACPTSNCTISLVYNGSPAYSLSVAGLYTVTVSYTEGVTKTASFTIIVIPDVSGMDGVITLPGGIITIPVGTVIADDGTITLPSNATGSITIQNGIEIEIPEDTVIHIGDDGTITLHTVSPVKMRHPVSGLTITITCGDISIAPDGTVMLLSTGVVETNLLTIESSPGSIIVDSGISIFAFGQAGVNNDVRLFAASQTLILIQGPEGSKIKTRNVGTKIDVPEKSRIDLSNATITLPSGESAVVTTSDDAVNVTVTGGIRVEPNDNITLFSGTDATIAAAGGTINIPSGGAIIECDYTFTCGVAASKPRYLFVLVGLDGAEIIYADSSVEPVPGGSVIMINSDGGVSIVEYSSMVLESIEITVHPAKTNYMVGEPLDLSGMVVIAAYSDGSTAPVTGYSTSPADNSKLHVIGERTVVVSYTESGITETTGFDILVSAPGDGRITLPGGSTIEPPDGTVFDDDGVMILPPNGGIITNPGGTTITLPGESTINPDGTITLPPDKSGTITTPDGTTIEFFGEAAINPDGTITLPSGGVAIVSTSDGNVKIKVEGGMKIESNGTITLLPGAVIETDDGTKIVLHSGGIIIEGSETFSAEMSIMSAVQLSATPVYLFVIVGEEGADITYPDESSETVPGGSIIRINPDGSIKIADIAMETLYVKQSFVAESWYFAPVYLGDPAYTYKTISRPSTIGGMAPRVDGYGRFVFAGQMLPANLSRAGEYVVKATVGGSGEIVAIYKIIVGNI